MASRRNKNVLPSGFRVTPSTSREYKNHHTTPSSPAQGKSPKQPGFLSARGTASGPGDAPEVDVPPRRRSVDDHLRADRHERVPGPGVRDVHPDALVRGV